MNAWLTAEAPAGKQPVYCDTAESNQNILNAPKSMFTRRVMSQTRIANSPH